jgi:leucyl-tRNA synthetase
VSSGTAGLHLLCVSAGVKPGDEVITSPYSFAASANCFVYEGGVPVFADVDRRTFNLDPAAVEAAVTPRTKAIVAVDIYGYPCELDELRAIAEKHGLAFIQDSCEALGAEYRGEWLGSHGRGRPAVSYRLRDWGFSRQRYWGAPIPIVYCDDCGIVALPEDDLPVLLPEVEDYKPKGIAPLAQAEDWVRTPCPRCGKEGRREVETMDTFVDSAWYFLRYCDPRNDEAAYDREITDYWMPVDHYTGGVDHATVHLIYARYFMKALNDLGLTGHREPFQRFFGNGFVTRGGSKISKRSGTATTPDELVETYGADATRLAILFIGPADQDMEWTESGVEGMQRFLRRLWRVVGEVAAGGGGPSDPSGGEALARKAHRTIARVTDDLGRRHQFNTPISAVMELVNDLVKAPSDPSARFAAETAVSLLQPWAPHITEELWETLGHERLWEEPWPVADPAMLEEDTFELVVQVNGKVRDRLLVPVDLPEDELVARAKESPKVQAHLDGGEIRQTIVVPRKLVNLVVG